MRFKGLGLGFGFVLLSAVALVAQYAPYYVLDGYGGVHAGGGAPVVTPAPTYFGWNIARDLVHVPVATSDTNHGDGLLVLDGFGGIHKGGKLSTVSVAATAYFGWDIARAIDFRRIDPQAYGTADISWVDYSDDNVHTLAGPINMVLPDAGYVLVTGSVIIINHTTTAGQNMVARVGIGVNSQSLYDAASMKSTVLEPVMLVSGHYNHQTVSVCRLFYFNSSGTQRFYLLAQRMGGSGILCPWNACFNAIYFNKRWDSYSMFSTLSPAAEDAALAPRTGDYTGSTPLIK